MEGVAKSDPERDVPAIVPIVTEEQGCNESERVVPSDPESATPP